MYAVSGRWSDRVTGFRHRRYAQSWREVGTPRELPHCGGWILERRIEGFGCLDATGCYPLFCCRDWSQLHRDINELGDGLVSLAIVADPFGDYDESYLRRCFPDTVVPFKQHYVIDLARPRNENASKHHRYYARKALREISVQAHPNPPEYIDEWMELHEHLVVKHRITGVKKFSRLAFTEQLATPGIVVLRATCGQTPVAAMLFFMQDEVVFAHVLGCSELGYELNALYAIIWSAMEHFRGAVRWLDIMGVPGVKDAGSEGIRQFKRGWTGETRMAWFCGRIFDLDRYRELAEATGSTGASYFPCYREGEIV